MSKKTMTEPTKPTLELLDQAATRELADGERVCLYEWAYANGLRLGGEH